MIPGGHALTLNNIHFSYHGRKILEDITIAVAEGSYLGLVGPNGSGKTTLANIIAGIIKPQQGSVDLHGHTVGLVLANPENQIVSLVVEEDVAFGPENKGLESAMIRERIDRALNITGCENLRYSLTSNLSGGQLAKVVFAGQMAIDVDILVLDEGTAMLDPVSRQVLLETLKDLNRQYNKTIVHISHRLEDLSAADRLVCLADGRLQSDRTGRQDVVDLIALGKVPGVELGSRISYLRYLQDLGIDGGNLRDATFALAGMIR